MKTFYKVLLGILFLCITSISTAQTTKEEVFDNIKQTGGVYFAYPSDKIKPETRLLHLKDINLFILVILADTDLVT